MESSSITSARPFATTRTTYSFSRTYRYGISDAGFSAAVLFEDGTPFYLLNLGRGGRCRVRHDCDDDIYIGVIVATEAAWFTRWRCQGPVKSYVATTKLYRDDANTDADQRTSAPHRSPLSSQ